MEETFSFFVAFFEFFPKPWVNNLQKLQDI